MITVDSNLLIYAYDQGYPRHDLARKWLERVLSGDAAVLLAWSSIHAFLRITTNDRIVKPALQMIQAMSVVQTWIDQPSVRIIEPGPRYWSILNRLARDAAFQGNRIRI